MRLCEWILGFTFNTYFRNLQESEKMKIIHLEQGTSLTEERKVFFSQVGCVLFSYTSIGLYSFFAKQTNYFKWPEAITINGFEAVLSRVILLCFLALQDETYIRIRFITGIQRIARIIESNLCLQEEIYTCIE